MGRYIAKWSFAVVRCRSAFRLALFRFSLSSGRVRHFLRLSCLNLVIVMRSPYSFFTLWVLLFFFSSLASVASFLHLFSLLSFPLALPRFLFFCLMFAPVSLWFLPHFVSFCLLFVCLSIWLSLCWFALVFLFLCFCLSALFFLAR